MSAEEGRKLDVGLLYLLLYLSLSTPDSAPPFKEDSLLLRLLVFTPSSLQTYGLTSIVAFAKGRYSFKSS